MYTTLVLNPCYTYIIPILYLYHAQKINKDTMKKHYYPKITVLLSFLYFYLCSFNHAMAYSAYTADAADSTESSILNRLL